MAGKRLCVAKTQVTESDKWILVPLAELHEIPNVIIEFDKISVDCNIKEIACPWLVIYDSTPMLKRKIKLTDPVKVEDESPLSGKTIWRVHGITGNCNVGVDMSDTSDVTKSNIYQYFLSDIHMKYAAAKQFISERGGSLRHVIQETGDIATFYADQMIECIIMKNENSKHPIKEFINVLLCNISTCCLLQAFSHNYSQKLMFCNEVEATVFPFCLKSDHDQYILPVDTCQRALDFFMEIENECNLFFLDTIKSNLFNLYIYIPKKQNHHQFPLTFTCKIDVTYRSLQDTLMSGSPLLDPLPQTPLFENPFLLSLCEVINCEKNLEQVEKNLCLFKEKYNLFYKK